MDNSKGIYMKRISFSQQVLPILIGTCLFSSCATFNTQKTSEYLTSAKNNLTTNPRQSIESANAIIKANNSNAEAYYLRGLAYQQLNNFAASESDFQSALKIDQKSESYMVGYANLLCQEQNYTKAQTYYDLAYNHAKQQKQSLTNIYINNGDCLTTQNKLDAAISSYTAALADESAPLNAYIGIAHAYVLQENFPIANYYLTLYKGVPNKQFLQIKLVTLNGLINTEAKLTNRVKMEQTINELKQQLGIYDDSLTIKQKTPPTKNKLIITTKSSTQNSQQQNNNNFDSRIKTDKNGKNYVLVEPGDTLFRISVNTNTSIDKLKMLNHLKGNEVVIGTKIFVN